MISIVVAVDKRHGIGRNGSIPWPHLDNDMKWFRNLTKNNVIIMGSVTWESISCCKLPDRVNVVVSKKSWSDADHSFTSPIQAIQECKKLYPESEIYIIGGQQLYDSTIMLADKCYITEIDQDYQCDRFFNLDYVQQNYQRVQEHHRYTDPVPYTITEYSN